MFMKTIEQERAESEAIVKEMEVVGTIRKLECSMYINEWDDPDMDTTETLYRDSKGAYHLRIELYHNFISADSVERISRKDADIWLRENVRTAFRPRNYRRLQIIKQRKRQERNEVKLIAKGFIEAFAEYFGERHEYA